VPSYLAEYRLRVRDHADATDLLVVTSVRGDVAPNYPHLIAPPKGDGASVNPLTGETMAGSYTGQISDGITAGTSRVVTSVLEDVNQRLQLGFLKAYWERRLNGGGYGVLCAGYLTLLRLSNDATWEFQVQDMLRVAGGVELFNATSSTLITDFLTAWPSRGCIIGGVKGGFLDITDLGGWQMKVHLLGSNLVWLEPLAIYSLPDFRTRARVTDIDHDSINKAASAIPLVTPNAAVNSFTTIRDTQVNGFWQGMVTLIDGVPFRPITPAHAGIAKGDAAAYTSLVWPGREKPGLFVRLDGQVLVDLAVVRVYVLTILPTDQSPIYVDSHPVDLLTTLCTLGGFATDAATCTTQKANMGNGLRETLRVSGSKQLGSAMRDWIFNIGVGVRVGTDGKAYPFSTRVFPNVVPATTIDDTMVSGDDRGLPFEQDATTGLQRVTLKQKHLLTYRKMVTGFVPDADISQRAFYEARLRTQLVNVQGFGIDGVGQVPNEITFLNGDAGALISGTLTIAIDGMLRISPDSRDPVGPDYLAAIAAQLFDRFGRGNQALERALVRGVAAVDNLNLGDEVIVAIKELPNHNKRYGDDTSVGGRSMQVVRITEAVATRVVRFADSGPNANALATVPTLTIAKSADRPRNVAAVTITNAAALNAAGYLVRIAVAVTAGGAPAAGDYVDTYASTAGAVPATAIRLPSIKSGQTVYAIARSEKAASRPSNWSGAASVALDAINPPTAFTATAIGGDGTQATAAWTVGANASDCMIDVFIRDQGSAFAMAVRMDTLPPGSISRVLTRLIVNHAYTVSVQHRDKATGDVSTVVDANVTTNNTTPALTAPINPAGFSVGVHDNIGAYQRGTIGIAVAAQTFPSDCEPQMAVETGVGTGLYGAFSQVGLVEAANGDWTLWFTVVPNDGLRRQLKMRHTRGAAVSAFSAIVTVTPWTDVAIPTYPVKPPTLTAIPLLASRTSTQDTVRFTFAKGTNDAGITAGQYQTDDGAPVAFGALVSPQDVVFTRNKFFDKHITAIVTQSDGQTAVAACNVPAQFPALDQATGQNDRAVAHSDTKYALQASESDGRTKDSLAYEPQGAIIPTPITGSPFSYSSGGPATGHMWVAWTWTALTAYRTNNISVGASSAMSTPPTAVGRLNQVAGGALGARTRWVRIGYVRDGKMYKVGVESSLAVNANNLLKVTAPASVTGYTGWCVLVGSTSGTEVFQSEVPATATLTFGADWTEPAGGATITTNTPYNAAMDNAVTDWGLNASTTYYYYPHYRLADSFVNLYAGGTSDTALNAFEATKDQRVGFALTSTSKLSMSATVPAGAGSNSGGGGGKF
jgi:hypothetical protein